MKKPALPALLIAVSMLTAAALASAGQNPAPVRAEYAFLERLVVLIIKAAAPTGGDPDISPDIIGLAKELKAAQTAKQVDDLFAVRYRRLLSAVRQALLMDPEVLYWPMYRHSMIDFIEERTGRVPEWKALQRIVNDHGGAGIGLGMIADAVISEVVSLHLYLDTLDKRPEILKSYLEKGMK